MLPNFVYKYPNKNNKLLNYCSIVAVKKGRTAIFTFLALLFIVCLPMHVFAAHPITQWADNKSGAVSITFDDGNRSDYTLAVPALNERGFKGSFYIVTDRIDNPAWDEVTCTWDEWNDVSNQGHEIGSHTKTHKFLTEFSLIDMERELSESKSEIDIQIPTQQCLTLAYPFGNYDTNVKTIASKYYIAARGISCDLNAPPYNFYGLRACGTSRTVSQMKAMADAAEEQGKWLISYFHALDGTNSRDWTINMFTTYLDYLKSKDLWVGTLSSVVKYIKEREAATLALISGSDDQIVVNLTDTLDDDIFDEPLTIRSEVPPNWTNVVIQQGGDTVTVTPVIEGTQSVVYYNVVPDRGNITLQKNTINQPTITGLNPSSTTVGGPSFTLTVYGDNYVNGSTVRWNGSSRSTIFVSGSQLKATIAASDISNPGTAVITVRNPSGDISNSMNFEIRNVTFNLTVQKSGTGSGSIAGTGISCGSDCTETYPYGMAVVLTAAPSTGSSFISWTGCTLVNGNMCTVDMTTNKSVMATFTLNQHTLTVAQTGSGSGILMASGLSCNENVCTGKYNYGETVQITASPAIRSVLGGWSGCDSISDNECTIFINGNKDITATFLRKHTFTVTNQGTGTGKVISTLSGIDCGEPSCSNTFVLGTPIQLTAVPHDASVFAFWSGGCIGTTETCNLIITDDIEVIAHFVPYGTNKYNLKVKRVHKNQGDGVITGHDGNLFCGDTCSYAYYKDTFVTLSAKAKDGSTFMGWKPDTLNCPGTDTCTVTVDKKKSVKAVFQGPNKLKVVTILKKGASGTVTSGDGLINCPGDCEELYTLNAPVTLTATAGDGSSFVKWTGRPCREEPTNICTFTMDKNATVKAIFQANPE